VKNRFGWGVLISIVRLAMKVGGAPPLVQQSPELGVSQDKGGSGVVLILYGFAITIVVVTDSRE
jgi:hypothetical protein